MFLFVFLERNDERGTEKNIDVMARQAPYQEMETSTWKWTPNV